MKTSALLKLFVDRESGVRGYLIGGNPALLAPYRIASEQIPPTLARLRAHLGGLGSPEQQLRAAVAAHERWIGEVVRPELDAATTGRLSAAQEIENGGRGKEFFDALRDEVARLDAAIQAAADANSRRISALGGRVSALLAAALAGLVLGAAGLPVAVLRLVVVPLDHRRPRVHPRSHRAGRRRS